MGRRGTGSGEEVRPHFLRDRHAGGYEGKSRTILSGKGGSRGDKRRSFGLLVKDGLIGPKVIIQTKTHKGCEIRLQYRWTGELAWAPSPNPKPFAEVALITQGRV